MPDILHRISIDAQAEGVHQLIATTDGIGRWWSGRPLDGRTETGASVQVAGQLTSWGVESRRSGG